MCFILLFWDKDVDFLSIDGVVGLPGQAVGARPPNPAGMGLPGNLQNIDQLLDNPLIQNMVCMISLLYSVNSLIHSLIK